MYIIVFLFIIITIIIINNTFTAQNNQLLKLYEIFSPWDWELTIKVLYNYKGWPG